MNCCLGDYKRLQMSENAFNMHRCKQNVVLIVRVTKSLISQQNPADHNCVTFTHAWNIECTMTPLAIWDTQNQWKKVT